MGYTLEFVNAAEAVGLLAEAGIALPESIAGPRELYPTNSKFEKDDP